MVDSEDSNNICGTNGFNAVVGDIVYIHSDITNAEGIDKIVVELDKLISTKLDLPVGDQRKRIIFDIDSEGGSVGALKLLLERIYYCRCTGIVVETRVLNKVVSAASLLAASGTPGHRYIGTWGEHLVHLGCVRTRDAFSLIEFERVVSRARKDFDFVFDFYNTNSKIPCLEEKLKDDELWVMGENAIDWGLADKYFYELTDPLT